MRIETQAHTILHLHDFWQDLQYTLQKQQVQQQCVPACGMICPEILPRRSRSAAASPFTPVKWHKWKH